MAAFEISRIHTHRGIFKINGEWQAAQADEAAVLESITQLAVLNTDGWEHLQLQDENVKALLAELTPILLFHLSH